MSLPKPTTPIYTLELPSNGKKIKYRPWIGKEEKSLQIAMMDDNKNTLKDTLISVLDACTFNELDISKLPDVDVDWLIVQLRMKSVGEIVELTMPCPSCKVEFDFMVNLMDSLVIDKWKEKRNTPIKVDENIFFKMKLPSKENYDLYSSNPDAETEDLIAMMIDSIYTNDEVSNPKDYTLKELSEYVNIFNKKTLKEVRDYVSNQPKVVVSNKAKCPHCKTEHNVKLEGADFFFV